MAITHARITNTNEFPIEDRYDGVPFVFEPGKAVRIPVAAAVVFFGMPVDVDGNVTWKVDAEAMAHFSRRHGWTNIEPDMMPNGQRETPNAAFQRVTRQAAEWCSKLKVEPVSMVLREVTEEEQPLPPPRDGAIEPQPKAEEAPKRRGGIATT